MLLVPCQKSMTILTMFKSSNFSFFLDSCSLLTEITDKTKNQEKESILYYISSFLIIYDPAMLKHTWAAHLWQFFSCSYPWQSWGLCHGHTQDSKISFILTIQHFVGLPICLIPCTSLGIAIPQESAVIYSHNTSKACQEQLPYPVVYFLL